MTEDVHDTSWNKVLLVQSIRWTCALIICAAAWAIWSTHD